MWNEVKVFTETVDGITFELFIAEPDFTLEDSFDDEDLIAMVTRQIEGGNQFGWFDAEVKASIFGVSESTYLGCNSYLSLEEFREDQYYTDMKQDSLDLLLGTLKELQSDITKYLETNK